MLSKIIPLAIESANQCLTHPPTPGAAFGSAIGSRFGPIGTFIGGTVGRMVESKLIR
jgi:hypothetical protein